MPLAELTTRELQRKLERGWALTAIDHHRGKRVAHLVSPRHVAHSYRVKEERRA